MKKTAFQALLALLIPAMMAQGQIHKLDTFMYSPTLDTIKMVDVILPPGYDTALNTYYPVVYYLHGWTGDQNSNPSVMYYVTNYINYQTIQPCILIKASSWCEPFEGSFYMNSPLWGNYQDYITHDLIQWVDSSFRTVAQKSHRGLLGQSMGAYGCLLLPTAYPAYYRAAAGHAGGGSFYRYDSLVESLVVQEHGSNPPYFYNYNSNKTYTRAWFVMAGAISPNPNTSQQYTSPQLVDYPLDEYGHIIDSTWEKFQSQAAEITIRQLSPADSVAFLLSCGTLDEFYQFEPMEDLVDTMQKYNLDVEWLPHTGGHTTLDVFTDRALIWLDSILGDPVTIDTTTGFIVTAPAHGIRFYPNPAGKDIWVEAALPNAALFSVALFDMEGKLVRELAGERQAQGSIRLNLSLRDIPAGSYLLHIRKGHHHLYDKLIIH